MWICDFHVHSTAVQNSRVLVNIELQHRCSVNRKPKSFLENENLIFKSFIGPMLTYGVFVWCDTVMTHRNKLEILQNLPWRFPTVDQLLLFITHMNIYSISTNTFIYWIIFRNVMQYCITC